NYNLEGFAINGLKFIKKVGAGTYGLIYTVEDSNGAQFAAKMVLKYTLGSNVAENKRYIERSLHRYFEEYPNGSVDEINLAMIARDGVHCPFLKEIALHLRAHQHPNVMTIHKVLNLGDLAIMTVMDYFEQGDLFTNIIDNQLFQKCPPQNQQLLMKNAMLQLIEAIQYLHENNIYHCDLKPENIMIHYSPDYVRPSAGTISPSSSSSTLELAPSIIDFNEIHLVLIDFGLAMEDDLICCNACRGSSFYMAPERVVNFNTNNHIQNIINLTQYVELPSTSKTCSLYFPTLAGDIWSLGVLFINIACSRNPWPIASIADKSDVNNDVFKTYIFHNRNILRSILPISGQFNKLLDRVFQLSPNDRIPLKVLYDNIAVCDFFQD
ncbi:kinase-like protein, partial [Suhomyces tanzawaensis NRRL Y-17324]